MNKIWLLLAVFSTTVLPGFDAIIVPEKKDPVTESAQEELLLHLEKRLRKKISVFTEGRSVSGKKIWLGDTAFARRAGFLHIHVFPYSKREGTPAATMKDQVPEAVKHERLAILSRVSEESCAAILDQALAHPNREFTILPETRGEGFVMGHTPDFLEIKVLTDCPLPRSEVHVRPLRREGETLICTPILD